MKTFKVKNALLALVTILVVVMLSASCEDDGTPEPESEFICGIEFLPPTNQRMPILAPSSEITSASTPLEIPVVFHVIYNTADENIPNDEILALLDEVNRDFALQSEGAVNGHIPAEFLAVAADTEIEFCLASRTPNGDFTNGITRTSTNVIEFPFGSSNIHLSSMGGKDAWNPTHYLNVWICNYSGNTGGYTRGIANVGNLDDGIVLNSGPIFDDPPLYSALTHEAGHYFGLTLHIWGGISTTTTGCDIDDGIDDTPLQERPAIIARPCSSNPTGPLDETCGSRDMGRNFMDRDALCMNMFTQGQKDVMRNGILQVRNTLLSSHGCGCADDITGYAVLLSSTPTGAGAVYTLNLNQNSLLGVTSIKWSGPSQVNFANSQTVGTDNVAQVFQQGTYPITVEVTLENMCTYTKTINVTFQL